MESEGSFECAATVKWARFMGGWTWSGSEHITRQRETTTKLFFLFSVCVGMAWVYWIFTPLTSSGSSSGCCGLTSSDRMEKTYQDEMCLTLFWSLSESFPCLHTERTHLPNVKIRYSTSRGIFRVDDARACVGRRWSLWMINISIYMLSILHMSSNVFSVRTYDISIINWMLMIFPIKY